MTKLIASFYLILVSVIAFFNQEPVEKTLSMAAMPMCNALPEDEVNQSSAALAPIAALPPFQQLRQGWKWILLKFIPCHC
ncbi:MAG: hypothetical protein IPO07_22060 [Haliscomenobacter sp.]|nr:hypothetical protein [Haliscomenobacter sp.]MBK9491169.1 hypothetical protein [Haliscomenobacter sp.]